MKYSKLILIITGIFLVSLLYFIIKLLYFTPKVENTVSEDTSSTRTFDPNEVADESVDIIDESAYTFNGKIKCVRNSGEITDSSSGQPCRIGLLTDLGKFYYLKNVDTTKDLGFSTYLDKQSIVSVKGYLEKKGDDIYDTIIVDSIE